MFNRGGAESLDQVVHQTAQFVVSGRQIDCGSVLQMKAQDGCWSACQTAAEVLETLEIHCLIGSANF